MFPLKDNIPTDRFPVVTVALIVINVLMYFLFQKGGLTLGDPSSQDVHVQPRRVRARSRTSSPTRAISARRLPLRRRRDGRRRWLTPLTSMFMHGGLLHLGGNMLFLWIFGNNVEDRMGPVKFIAFYLLGGVAALALQAAIDPDSEVPTIGASGAVAAVLGGYLLLFPRARVLTAIFLIFFFTLIEIPAIVMLGLWFVQQVVFGYFDLTSPAGGGRRRGVLRPHRRLRVRAAGDQAVREPRAKGGARMARRVITAACAFLLWAVLSFLTLFVLFTSGPDIARAAVAARARHRSGWGCSGRSARRVAPEETCEASGAVRRRRRAASWSPRSRRTRSSVGSHGPARVASAGAERPGAAPASPLDVGTAPAPLSVRLADPHDAVRLHFKRPPRAGLLFDVDTGRVLWRHRPDARSCRSPR